AVGTGNARGGLLRDGIVVEAEGRGQEAGLSSGQRPDRRPRDQCLLVERDRNALGVRAPGVPDSAFLVLTLAEEHARVRVDCCVAELLEPGPAPRLLPSEHARVPLESLAKRARPGL